MGFGPKAPFGPMPLMGMPMMEMGAAFGPGLKGRKRHKGKKKGPKGPMVPFGPMPYRHHPFGK